MPHHRPSRPPFAVLGSLLLAMAGGVGCQGIRTPGFERLNVSPAAEQSVRPGINDGYLAADIDVNLWTERFEVESREIYHARAEIVRVVALRPGQAVADIGAGTGLFLEPFADAVGPTGVVYSLDIVPAFVEHMTDRAAHRNLTQVDARLCSQRSINLPDDSIDVAFVCDVYHHFEYPRSSLASIYTALRPGGELIVIDFVRTPGVSREWVLGHVRAGQAEFTAEIERAGFRLDREVTIDGFEESYFLRFRKPSR
jgi:ubiquinone/menaquinone biosynthesis C-methylase UbiE